MKQSVSLCSVYFTKVLLPSCPLHGQCILHTAYRISHMAENIGRVLNLPYFLGAINHHQLNTMPVFPPYGIFCIQSSLEGEECSTWQVQNCFGQAEPFCRDRKTANASYKVRDTNNLCGSVEFCNCPSQAPANSCVVDHRSSVQIHTGKNST